MPFTIFNKVALLFKRVDKIEPQVDEIQEDVGQYLTDYLDTYINEDYLVQTGVIPNNDDTSKCATTEWTNDTIDTVNDTCLHKTGNESASGIKTFTDNCKVADAESGATDTSMVNANWISQTGDSAPNNLIHRSGGTESIIGTKRFLYNVEHKNENIPSKQSPSTYISGHGKFRMVDNGNNMIAGIGFEKAAVNSTRIVLSIIANEDTVTHNQTGAEIHFILDEVNGKLFMQPAHIDKDGVRSFGIATDLMTWTP